MPRAHILDGWQAKESCNFSSAIALLYHRLADKTRVAPSSKMMRAWESSTTSKSKRN